MDTDGGFPWPGGARAALSLSFDDGRASQVDHGIPLLDAHGIRATFYVVPGNIAERVEAWRAALRSGHEIGNHTLTHPCPRKGPTHGNAVEDHTLATIAQDIERADDEIERLLDVRPTTFAYPCGASYVGRGEGVVSYVPLVARRFRVGRGGRHGFFHPRCGDLSLTTASPSDLQSFDDLKELVDTAVARGVWLILIGHDTLPGRQRLNTDLRVLEELCAYARGLGDHLWIDTIAAVGSHVRRASATSA